MDRERVSLSLPSGFASADDMVRPSPPSLQLASLLSSAHSSLLLFYTSLHQTLHPSRSTTAPPSVSRHTRTAPIQMVLKRAVAGPAHQAMMFWCEVLQWRAHSTIITRLLPPDNGDGDSAMDGEGHEEKGDEVLTVFQPVPNECPRLGVDPRVAKGKLDEGKRWEVGVWGPWAEIELCVSPEAFKAGRTSGGDDEKEGDMDMDVDGGGGGKHDREEKKTKVLMVTRYLVAHAEL